MDRAAAFPGAAGILCLPVHFDGHGLPGRDGVFVIGKRWHVLGTWHADGLISNQIRKTPCSSVNNRMALAVADIAQVKIGRGTVKDANSGLPFWTECRQGLFHTGATGKRTAQDQDENIGVRSGGTHVHGCNGSILTDSIRWRNVAWKRTWASGYCRVSLLAPNSKANV